MSAFQMDPELAANFPAYVSFLSADVNEFLTEDVFDLLKTDDSYLTNTIPTFIKEKITTKIFSTYKFYFTKKRSDSYSVKEEQVTYLDGLFNQKLSNMGDSKVELSLNEYLQTFLAIWMNRIKTKLSQIVTYKNFFLILESFDEYFKDQMSPTPITNDVLAQVIFKRVYEPAYEEARIEMADKINDCGNEGLYVHEDFAERLFSDDNMLEFYVSFEDKPDNDLKPKSKQKIGDEIRKAIVEIIKLPFEEFLPSDMGQSTLNTFMGYVNSVLSQWTLSSDKWNKNGIDMNFFKQLYQVKNGTYDKISQPQIDSVELKGTNVLLYSNRRLLLV
jgi:hypothetical protein